MNDRTCIVTRQHGERDRLIRFVAGPDGVVVPDLKQSLPGRGCWVTGTRRNVDLAASKNMFARALRTKVKPGDDLGAMVDALLARSALGAIGLARKAGGLALGAAKVDAEVRRGSALAVLHAQEASDDGEHKLRKARRAVKLAGGPEIAAFKLFSEGELSLALGGTNVIHAALLAGSAGRAALKRVKLLLAYREVPDGDNGEMVAPADKMAS